MVYHSDEKIMARRGVSVNPRAKLWGILDNKVSFSFIKYLIKMLYKTLGVIKYFFSRHILDTHTPNTPLQIQMCLRMYKID